jgi:dTDP-4-dehydrorhamnose reductase
VSRVLVTGGGGQVGAEVARELAPSRETIVHDRRTLDLEDAAAIVARVREARPDIIVNAAAYTAVDRAEAEPARAHAVNAIAAGVLAEEAKRAGALLVHYSTDYVFDGTKPGPYVEDDPVAPLNVYGQTKLEGERAIVASGCRHLILRTSWVYGPRGGNFLFTMLRLARERPELRVVDDQRGAPTSSLQLARATRELIERDAPGGLFHATAAGETTWFGFAGEIFAAEAASDPSFQPPALVPIPSSAYPTPARRPANSVLSNERLSSETGVVLAGWREGLAEVISAIRAGGRLAR